MEIPALGGVQAATGAITGGGNDIMGQDDFLLLLEDLTTDDCRFSDGTWGVDADAAAKALEELAACHARFENEAARDRVAPWLRDPDRTPGSEATSGLMRFVLDQNADALSDTYKAIGERYVEHHAGLLLLLRAGADPTVLDYYRT